MAPAFVARCVTKKEIGPKAGRKGQIKSPRTKEMAAGDEFARRLTDEALSRMHYLHAALTETLRLYPSLPLAVGS